MNIRVLIIEGQDNIIEAVGEPTKIPLEQSRDKNEEDKVVSISPRRIKAELEEFKRDIRRRYASFLQKNPAWARSVDALNLSPDTTLAPAPPGEERQLITRRDLPAVAPALWARDKQPGDTPPDFIQRHYGLWLGKGFTQADLRRLDPQGEVAWRHWKRKNAAPLGFDLPTKSEELARETSRLAPPDSPEATAIRRLGYRLYKQRER